MKLYISHDYRDLCSAGNKAKSDAEKILAEEGWLNIGLPQTVSESPRLHFALNLQGMMKATASINPGDVLFVQYPLNKYYSFIMSVAKRRGAKTVVLVHDLNSYRLQRLGRRVEMMRLGKADYIIATNPRMATLLNKIGLKQARGVLGAWDYLTDTDPIPSRIREEGEPMRIAYAGEYSREKNGFVWEWGNVIKDYVVDIYGRGFRLDEVAHPEKFYDHGYVEAENLIAGMTSDFGLVWDGDSLNGCRGDHGRYLAINTPHKLSLYLRARLPIIIWRGAAMADFVTENGIGFTIDKLEEINTRLRSLTPEEYDLMRRNVERVAERIASGDFLRSALAEVENEVVNPK